MIHQARGISLFSFPLLFSLSVLLPIISLSRSFGCLPGNRSTLINFFSLLVRIASLTRRNETWRTSCEQELAVTRERFSAIFLETVPHVYYSAIQRFTIKSNTLSASLRYFQETADHVWTRWAKFLLQRVNRKPLHERIIGFSQLAVANSLKSVHLKYVGYMRYILSFS